MAQTVKKRRFPASGLAAPIKRLAILRRRGTLQSHHYYCMHFNLSRAKTHMDRDAATFISELGSATGAVRT